MDGSPSPAHKTYLFYCILSDLRLPSSCGCEVGAAGVGVSGVPHMHTHAHTYTHVHNTKTYTYRNCKWLPCGGIHVYHV